MRNTIYIIICLFLTSGLNAQKRYVLPAPEAAIKLVPLIAQSQVGVKEVGNNRGKEVEAYLKSVGLPPGNPYCASGVYWTWCQALAQSGHTMAEMPLPRTGLAYSMFLHAKKYGVLTPYKASVTDCIDWRYPQNSSGHIEIVVKTGSKGWVEIVGFNTGSSNAREGQGVRRMTRNIYLPLHRMQIMGLIGFK